MSTWQIVGFWLLQTMWVWVYAKQMRRYKQSWNNWCDRLHEQQGLHAAELQLERIIRQLLERMTREQLETFVTLRRDGTATDKAIDLAIALHPTEETE